MSRSTRISRRTVLRGLGTAIALPWMEGMARAADIAAGKPGDLVGPKRMAFFYVPNGAHKQDWPPSKEGAIPPCMHTSVAPPDSQASAAIDETWARERR